MYRLIIMSAGILMFLYYAHVIAFLFGLVKSIGKSTDISFLKCIVPFYYWIKLK